MRSIIARSFSSRLAVPAGLLHGVGVITMGLVLATLLMRFSAPAIGAGVLGLAFCAVFFARPDIGLLIVLLVRSFTDLGLQSAGWEPSVMQALLSPNASLILILILAGGLYIVKHNARLLSLPGGTLLTLLLMTGLVGMLRSENVLFSFREWLPVVSTFVVYALSAHFFRTPRQIQGVVDVIAASFVLPAIYGFYQLTGHHGLILKGGLDRIYGTFDHPNPFSFYLAMIVTLFACQSLATSGKRRMLSMVIVAAAGVLLVGTLTRMAWVGTAIALLTVGAFRNRKMLILVPLAAVFVAVVFPNTVARVGNPLVDPAATGLEDRFEVWQSTLTFWMNATQMSDSSLATMMNRLGGLGPGSVIFLTGRREGASYSAHNDYIRVLSEFGVFGLGMYVLLLIVVLMFGYRTLRASAATPMAAVPLSFFALTLAYTIMSFTDNVFGATQNQVYYWALAGMTAAISQTLSAKASGEAAGSFSRTSPRGTSRTVPKAAGV